MRVLVIDDEAPLRLLCRLNLEAEGMDVVEAADGVNGLRLAREAAPDIVVLDVMMPGRDGWQVAGELLAEAATASLPIVFLTARAELGDRAGSLDLDGVQIVTKPFDPLDLARIVEALAAAGPVAGGTARRAALEQLRRDVDGV